MKSARALVVLVPLALAASLAASFVACLDMTPYYVPPPPDASMNVTLDAGTNEPDAPDADMRPPCERCVETPDDAHGCADELAACLADAVCNQIFACVLANGCLEKPNQRQAIVCGLPCASAAGIVDQTDPSAQLAIGVVNCAETACVGICLPEGGAATDSGG